MEQATPAYGSYTSTPLRSVHYGVDSINELAAIMEHILSKDAKPKALIITGKSLSKTPVIPQIEDLLKQKNAFCGTFTKMRQHTPIDDVEEALEIVRKEGVTVLLGVGGGSPIDACKTISYFHNERHGSFIPHIAIPTTLSAAEFTQIAGHTNKEGSKTLVTAEEICPKAVILDPKIAQHTPMKLWLSTGIRALDHAVETLYRPGAQYPIQQMALVAIRDLFIYLPQHESSGGKNLETINKLQVAAWMSLFPAKLETALGLSHGLGHILGATYSIPHGVCSVLTLAPTVRQMARSLPPGPQMSMLAKMFDYIPESFDSKSLGPYKKNDGNDLNACLAAADAIALLTENLGLKTSLSQFKVPKGDLTTIAKKAYEATSGKPGWKDICPTENQLLTQILEPIF